MSSSHFCNATNEADSGRFCYPDSSNNHRRYCRTFVSTSNHCSIPPNLFERENATINHSRHTSDLIATPADFCQALIFDGSTQLKQQLSLRLQRLHYVKLSFLQSDQRGRFWMFFLPRTIVIVTVALSFQL
jgi:hypothetical protein